MSRSHYIRYVIGILFLAVPATAEEVGSCDHVRVRPSAHKEAPYLSPALLLQIMNDTEAVQYECADHRTNHEKLAKLVREQEAVIKQLQEKAREHARLIQILMRRLIDKEMHDTVA